MSGINTLLKEFYINSSAPYRNAGGTNEDFVITENGRHLGPPKTPKFVKLASASIPYTWYNVTTSNNAFTLVEGGTSYPVTIPVGNYDGAGLATALTTALNASGGANTYTVTYSTVTSKLTFAAAPGTFRLNFNVANSIALLVGFPAGTLTAIVSSITAPNVVALTPDYEIFICSDLVQGCDNGIMMWDTAAPSNTQILGRVTVSGSHGGILSYRGYEYEPFFDMRASPYAAAATSQAVPSPPRTMHFWLQFPSGLPVDLNGSFWSATLVVDFGSEINI